MCPHWNHSRKIPSTSCCCLDVCWGCTPREEDSPCCNNPPWQFIHCKGPIHARVQGKHNHSHQQLPWTTMAPLPQQGVVVSVAMPVKIGCFNSSKDTGKQEHHLYYMPSPNTNFYKLWPSGCYRQTSLWLAGDAWLPSVSNWVKWSGIISVTWSG